MDWVKKYKLEYIALLISIVLVALIAKRLIAHHSYTKTRLENTSHTSPILVTDKDIILGDNDAPLSIILFYSYSCSPCIDFFSDTYPKLVSNYIKPGRLKLILKPVNLMDNEEMYSALETLYCLNNLGQFNSMHQLLSTDISVIYSQQFKLFNNKLINSNNELQSCLANHESRKLVNRNNKQLKKLGMEATPTFVIDKLVYRGRMEYYLLDKILKKQQQ